MSFEEFMVRVIDKNDGAVIGDGAVHAEPELADMVVEAAIGLMKQEVEELKIKVKILEGEKRELQKRLDARSFM